MGLKYPKDITSFLAQLPTSQSELRALSNEFKYYLVLAEKRSDWTAADSFLETLSHITYRILKFSPDDFALSYIAAYEHQLPLMKWNPFPSRQKVVVDVPWPEVSDELLEDIATCTEYCSADRQIVFANVCEVEEEEQAWFELTEGVDKQVVAVEQYASVSVVSDLYVPKVCVQRVERPISSTQRYSPWLSKSTKSQTPIWLRKLYSIGYSRKFISLLRITRSSQGMPNMSASRWFRRKIRGPQFDDPEDVLKYIWLSLNESKGIANLYETPSSRFVRLVSALGNFIYCSDEVMLIGDGRSDRPPDLVSLALGVCVQRYWA